MHYIRVLWLYFSDKEAFGGLLLSPPCDVKSQIIRHRCPAIMSCIMFCMFPGEQINDDDDDVATGFVDETTRCDRQLTCETALR